MMALTLLCVIMAVAGLGFGALMAIIEIAQKFDDEKEE